MHDNDFVIFAPSSSLRASFSTILFVVRHALIISELEESAAVLLLDDDDDDHIRRNKSSIPSGHPHSGDDYTTSQTKLPKVVYQYIYPPNVPWSVQLCRSENIAIPACYLLVGLLQGLSGPFTNVYPLDLNASEAQQVRFLF